MRSLATLGGVIVLIVLAIAWKISNQVEAGQEPDPNSGVVMLGVLDEDSPTVPPTKAGDGAEDKASATGTDQTAAGNRAATGLKSRGSGDLEQPSPESSVGNPPTGTAQDPDAPSDPVQPVASVTGIVYQVQEDDTLYSILMRAYGKASPELIEAVASANDMDDPSALQIGLSLRLPVVEGFRDPKEF